MTAIHLPLTTQSCLVAKTGLPLVPQADRGLLSSARVPQPQTHEVSVTAVIGFALGSVGKSVAPVQRSEVIDQEKVALDVLDRERVFLCSEVYRVEGVGLAVSHLWDVYRARSQVGACEVTA
jgi:hypothetical protein